MRPITARSLGAALALFLCAAAAAPVFAQSSRAPQAPAAGASGGKLGDMIFDRRNARRAAAPAIARYAVEDSTSFVLDRSTEQTLLRFDGSDEVWALTPQDAPRGDTIYKNDMGQPVLRASRLGGLTVFTPRRPEGAAAALSGEASSLQLRSLQNAIVIANRLKSASDRATAVARRRIGFIAPDFGQESASALVDAAFVTAAVFERVARNEKSGNSNLQKIDQVVFVEGEAAGARVEKRALTITVVPGRGVAGRPSSERILKALNSKG